MPARKAPTGARQDSPGCSKVAAQAARTLRNPGKGTHAHGEGLTGRATETSSAAFQATGVFCVSSPGPPPVLRQAPAQAILAPALQAGAKKETTQQDEHQRLKKWTRPGLSYGGLSYGGLSYGGTRPVRWRGCNADEARVAPTTLALPSVVAAPVNGLWARPGANPSWWLCAGKVVFQERVFVLPTPRAGGNRFSCKELAARKELALQLPTHLNRSANPMSRLRRHDRSSQSGFTLLELMIVLALIAFLVAMVWPSLRKPLQRSTTQQAARRLVEDLSRARLNAIETGRTMAVRYEPGGGRYWIGPADMLAGDTQTDGAIASGSGTSENDAFESDSASNDDGNGPSIELVIEATFEDDVVFQDPTAADDAAFPRDSTLGTMLADEMAETEEVEPLVQDEAADIGWSAPVLIYPTGRAENGSFVLLGPEGYSVTVTLRGLTGAVSVGPLEHEVRIVDEPGADGASADRLPQDDVTEGFDSLDTPGASL